MPSWNGAGEPKVFNDSTIVGSTAIRRRLGTRLVAKAAEARRTGSARPYWSVDVSGKLLSPEQLQEIRALELMLGFMEPVLLRLASYCLLETTDNEGNITAAPLGTGTGAPATYQLVKSFTYQGQTTTDVIRYPWHDYPALQDLNGQDWEPLPELQIYDDGVDITDACTIDRLTGEVTCTANGAVSATGGFLWKMLLPNGFPVSLKGGIYEVKDGVTFEEPFEDQ